MRLKLNFLGISLLKNSLEKMNKNLTANFKIRIFFQTTPRVMKRKTVEQIFPRKNAEREVVVTLIQLNV